VRAQHEAVVLVFTYNSTIIM